MEDVDRPSVTFETELVTAGQKPVYHYLYVERELVALLGIRGIIRRVMCTLNDKVSFPCSLMGNARGAYKISVNKEHRNKAGIVPGDTCKVTLVRDDSEYGIPVPPELVEVLDQDPASKKAFRITDQWPPTRHRLACRQGQRHRRTHPPRSDHSRTRQKQRRRHR